MADLIRRKAIGQAWETEEDTGGGGSQTLAQVLATGSDAGGQQATNLADGTAPQDAATVSQLPPAPVSDYLGNGGTVTINGGDTQPLPWDSPSTLLDVTVPTAPKIIAPGAYIFTVTTLVETSTSFAYELSLAPQGSTAIFTKGLSDAGGLAVLTIPVVMAVANQSIQAFITNGDSDPVDFQMDSALIVRVR